MFPSFFRARQNTSLPQQSPRSCRLDGMFDLTDTVLCDLSYLQLAEQDLFYLHMHIDQHIDFIQSMIALKRRNAFFTFEIICNEQSSLVVSD